MQHLRYYGFIPVLIAVVLFQPYDAEAASAVAVGLSSDGKAKYGYSCGGKATEEEVRSRAIGFCMASGGMKSQDHRVNFETWFRGSYDLPKIRWKNWLHRCDWCRQSTGRN
jgi:hypothetical protein